MTTKRLRICSNNLLERGNLVESIMASTEVGSMPASNLLSSVKSIPWRSSSIAGPQILTIVFKMPQLVSMVAAMFTNFSVTATLNVYLYTNKGDSIAAYSSPNTGIFDNTIINQAVPAAQNSYSYGGGSQGVVYFPEMVVEKVVFSITDISNTSGYLQIGNLIIGKYWSPLLNFERGETVQIMDDSKAFRTDSSDYYSDFGTRYRKLGFKLSNMQEVDRIECVNMLRSNGTSLPIFISLFPENADPTLESLYCVQGILESIAQLDNPMFNRYAIPLTIAEI